MIGEKVENTDWRDFFFLEVQKKREERKQTDISQIKIAIIHWITLLGFTINTTKLKVFL